MVGHFLFTYLISKYAESTWGTARDRRNKNLIYFDCHKLSVLENIFRDLNGINYVINCIGALISQNSIEEQIYLNAYFPHILEDLAEKYNFSVINIGTDAVFASNTHKVTESTFPSPSNVYGMCKLLGESQSNRSITFRTSILGINKFKNTGFLNWIIENKNGNVNGYVNQKWSGCTTLQFAILCHELINSNNFSKLRKLSPVFHFAPILSTTKFEIADAFIKKLSYKCVLTKAKGPTITRNLDTKYKDVLASYCRSSSIGAALHDLVIFEGLTS